MPTPNYNEQLQGHNQRLEDLNTKIDQLPTTKISQEKIAVPTSSEQIITPDDESKTLSKVIIKGTSSDYITIQEKGAINGVATLDNSGKIPNSQINADTELSESSEAPVQNKIITTKLATKSDKSYVDQTFANAFTKTVTGPVVAVDDVSPVVSDVSIDATGTTTVHASGKNIFNIGNVDRFFYVDGADVPPKRASISDGVITMNETKSWANVYMPITAQYIPAGRYCVSADVYIPDPPNTRLAFTLNIRTTNADYYRKTNAKSYNTWERIAVVINVVTGGEAFGVSIQHDGSSSVTRTSGVKIRNIQVEFAAEVTDYEEYNGDVVSVPGVFSASHSFTVIPDSPGDVTATYNRDSNKVVQGLMDRIAALEGAKTNI